MAGLYLLGVRRLRSRGDRWPLRRSLAFLVGGPGTVAVATLSGLATYDLVSFTGHMVQHMLLAMVAPVFLALGAPVTLALRTLPGTASAGRAGCCSGRCTAGRPGCSASRRWAWRSSSANPFALYFSGLYPATLESPLLHGALHVHFLLVGCLFFWPLLGLDPVPRVAHPFRLLTVFAALPFHAFLGIAIMSRDTLIAASHYTAVAAALPWYDDPLGDQHTGGGLLWASGDLVGLLFFGVLLFQWMRDDERQAVRLDRRADRYGVPGGDELAAYNARLAALAARDG